MQATQNLQTPQREQVANPPQNATWQLTGSVVMLTCVRLALGVFMLTAGYRLMFEGGWKAWLQIGHVLPTAVEGPFAGPFTALWENPIVLFMVIFGATTVGLSMVFGFLARLGAFGGAVMMVAFYVATLPPHFGWVNEYAINFLVFVYFMTKNPGYFPGLDRLIQRKFADRFPKLHWLVG
jgi:uncharacterized membrane protein YphA (DoxX/SURF4 family)